jgi:uncharacterized protein YjbJ (UPF0337 family)
MDENRIAGTARNFGGKAEEGVGRVMGDAKTQVRGMADQAAGAAQDLYGQARDTAADAAVAARDTAASFEKWLRRTIETQPYTTALVAIGIGWLLGRMHRPLHSAPIPTYRGGGLRRSLRSRRALRAEPIRLNPLWLRPGIASRRPPAANEGCSSGSSPSGRTLPASRLRQRPFPSGAAASRPTLRRTDRPSHVVRRRRG